MNKLIVGFAEQAIGAPKGSITLTCTSNTTAKTDIISVLGAYTHVGSNPEISDIKIPANSRVKQFIGLFLWNAATDDDWIGNLFAFGQLEGCVGCGCECQETTDGYEAFEHPCPTARHDVFSNRGYGINTLANVTGARSIPMDLEQNSRRSTLSPI
ncbi:MAG: hypothetical protein OEY60_03130 [Nitrospira sp.]|nr:hypothetical protein [Nitrospira sp.]MDH5724442.1 hypothetical protein [Nitrospira sp.]